MNKHDCAIYTRYVFFGGETSSLLYTLWHNYDLYMVNESPKPPSPQLLFWPLFRRKKSSRCCTDMTPLGGPIPPLNHGDDDCYCYILLALLLLVLWFLALYYYYYSYYYILTIIVYIYICVIIYIIYWLVLLSLWWWWWWCWWCCCCWW
jgi:hypothetical protein